MLLYPRKQIDLYRVNTENKKKKARVMVELERHKSRRIAKGGRLQIQHEPDEEEEDIFANADPKKWKMSEIQFDSQYGG